MATAASPTAANGHLDPPTHRDADGDTHDAIATDSSAKRKRAEDQDMTDRKPAIAATSFQRDVLEVLKR